MRPAVLLLAFAVCKPPPAPPPPEPDGDPLAARCRGQVAVVHNTLVSGQKRQIVDEIQRLAALDRLLATGAMPSDVTAACHRELHDTLADLVFVWNQEMTTGCTAFAHRSWPQLETLLHEFLADFPGDPRAPEARRALERLYALQRR